MYTLEPLLAKHPFFQGLEPQYLATIAGCGSNSVFKDGDYLFRQGDEADSFYIVRHGKVAVELDTAAHEKQVIYTHNTGDVVGWSWFFPPYYWRFSGRAVGLTRAVTLNGKCLREKCETDPKLGFELLKRFSQKVVHSLDETRMQLLDFYRYELRR